MVLDRIFGFSSASEAGSMQTAFDDTRAIADTFTSAGLPIDPQLKSTQDFWTGKLNEFSQIGKDVPTDDQVKQMARLAGGIDTYKTMMTDYYNDAGKALQGMTTVANAAENYQVKIVEQGVQMQNNRFQQANRMVTMAQGLNRQYHLLSGGMAAAGFNGQRFQAIGRRAGNIL